jgi:hypothetical protein
MANRFHLYFGTMPFKQYLQHLRGVRFIINDN